MTRKPKPALFDQPPEPEPPPDDGFDAFWREYPRKVGKLDARKAWKSIKRRPALEVILGAIAEARLTEQWTKDGKKFIPHPATWLRRGGWMDEQEPTEDSFEQRLYRNGELSPAEVARLKAEGKIHD